MEYDTNNDYTLDLSEVILCTLSHLSPTISCLDFLSF